MPTARDADCSGGAHKDADSAEGGHNLHLHERLQPHAEQLRGTDVGLSWLAQLSAPRVARTCQNKQRRLTLMRGTLRTKRLPLPSCRIDSGSRRANLSVGKLIYLLSALSPPWSCAAAPLLISPRSRAAAHAKKRNKASAVLVPGRTCWCSWRRRCRLGHAACCGVRALRTGAYADRHSPCRLSRKAAAAGPRGVATKRALGLPWRLEWLEVSP